MSIFSLVAGAKPDTLVSADPAANVEASITVPKGKTLLVVCAHLTVVATVQTPLPNLRIADALGNVIGLYPGASAALSAGVTSTFDWYEGATLTAGAAATSNRSPIPRGLCVKGGWVVSTLTTGIGVNTNLSALALHVIAL